VEAEQPHETVISLSNHPRNVSQGLVCKCTHVNHLIHLARCLRQGMLRGLK